MTLFADRVRTADAGFALTVQNRADVPRLVSRLDGMPLAIELAGGDRLAAGGWQITLIAIAAALPVPETQLCAPRKLGP